MHCLPRVLCVKNRVAVDGAKYSAKVSEDVGDLSQEAI